MAEKDEAATQEETQESEAPAAEEGSEAKDVEMEAAEEGTKDDDMGEKATDEDKKEGGGDSKDDKSWWTDDKKDEKNNSWWEDENKTEDADKTEEKDKTGEQADGEQKDKADSSWWGDESKAEGDESKAEGDESKAEGDESKAEDKEKDEQPEGEENKEEEQVQEPEPGPGDAFEMDIDWEAAAWFQEEDSARVRKLERLSGGKAEVTDEKLKLTPASEEPPEGGCGTGRSWCELCAKAMCALRKGEEIELPQAAVDACASGADAQGLGMCIVEIPGACPQKFVSGKEGSRLNDWTKDDDVCAVFVWTKEPEPEAPPAQEPKVGDKADCKFGNSWFEAEILEVNDGKIKVKWDFDSSEAELDAADVSVKAAEVKEEEKKEEKEELKVGSTVEGKYGESWFEAEVLEVKPVFSGSEVKVQVKVKWGHDSSEAELDVSDVRQKGSGEEAEEKEPEGPPSKLWILGLRRPRLQLELRVLQCIEGKSPGHVAKQPKTTEEGDGVGFSVMDLKPVGGNKKRLIGTKGARKMRFARVCSAALEYLGEAAYVVGTREERAKTLALLELVQSSVDFRVKATELPAALEGLSTVFTVPGGAAESLTGRNILDPEEAEDATDTVILALGKTTQASGPTEKTKYEVGQVVECKVKGEWIEATIESISSWNADSDDEDETDGRTLKLKYQRDGKESAVPVNCVREKLDAAAAQERERALQRAKSRKLVIIGKDPERRRQAELQLAAKLEMQYPKSFSDAAEDPASGISIVCTLQKLEKEQAERFEAEEGKKQLQCLGVAAGCAVVLSEQTLCFAGGSQERCARGQTFLTPILSDPPNATDADSIEDATNLLVPKEKKKNLPQRVLLDESDKLGVFVFFDEGASLAGVEDMCRLVCCSHDEAKRNAALERFKELQEVEPPEEEWKEEKWDNDDAEKKDEWADDKGKDEWAQDDKGKSWDKEEKWDDKKDDKWESKDEGWNKKDDWGKKDDNKRKWEDDSKSSWGEDKKQKDDGWGGDKSWGGDQKEEEKRIAEDGKAYTYAEFQSCFKGKADEKWNASQPEGGGGGSSRDKKDNSWDKKQDSWGDKKQDSWDKKDNSWDKKQDSWDKKDKKDDWGAGAQEEKRIAEDGKAYTYDEFKGCFKGRADDMWNKAKPEGGGDDDASRDKKDDSWGSWSKKEDKKQDSWGDKQESKSWDSKPQQQKRSWESSQAVDDSWGGGQKRQRPQAQPAAAYQSAPAQMSSMTGGRGSAPSQAAGNRGIYAQQVASRASQARPMTAFNAFAPQAQSAPPWQQKPAFQPLGGGRQAGQQAAAAYASQAFTQSDPKAILETMAMPDSIDEWQAVQDTVWRGHSKLPAGWIRVWSKRHDHEYYLRLDDNFATFEISEVE